MIWELIIELSVGFIETGLTFDSYRECVQARGALLAEVTAATPGQMNAEVLARSLCVPRARS